MALAAEYILNCLFSPLDSGDHLCHLNNAKTGPTTGFQQLADRNTQRRQGAETSPAHCTSVWDWPPTLWAEGAPGAFPMDPLNITGPGLSPE